MVIVRAKPAQNAGVVVSWDLHCKKSNEWIEEKGIRELARGVDQPLYCILNCRGDYYYYPEGEGN